MTMPSPLPKLYVKTGCPWCHEAMEFLDRRKIRYEKITVTGNDKAIHDMVAVSGQIKAPVLDWHDDVLADFGADELEPFLKNKGII